LSREDIDIKTLRYTWGIHVILWGFDGVLQRPKILLKITVKVSLREEFVDIMSLKFYFLQYAPIGVEKCLEPRGHNFRQLRFRKIVSCSQEKAGNLTNVSFQPHCQSTSHNPSPIHWADGHFMVDIETFKAPLSLAQSFLHDGLGLARMAINDPPPNGFLSLFSQDIICSAKLGHGLEFHPRNPLLDALALSN
jgi:hypothetical protein